MHFTLFRGVRDYHQKKTFGTGLWFSTSKLVALSYSENVVKKEIDSDDVVVLNCKGATWRKINTDALARKYKDHDVIVFKNVVDLGPNAKVFNHFKAEKGKKVADYFTADTVVVNNDKLLKEDYFPY